MEAKETKAKEYEIQNLMQLRGNCISFVLVISSGIIGLILSEFSYLKLVLIVLGCISLCFLFLLISIIDKEIDLKIKELRQ